MSDTYQRYKNYCLYLLGRREYSRLELLKKAAQDIPKEIVNQVLDELSDKDLQSDERFCLSFIRQKKQRGEGKLKIKQGLKAKGISEVLIEKHLINIDWLDIALELYQRKFKNEKPKDYKDLAKRQRFLLSRGFSYDEIKEIMKKVEK